MAVKEDTQASDLGNLTDVVVPEEKILGGETGFGGREFIFILNTLEFETPMEQPDGVVSWAKVAHFSRSLGEMSRT